jgi:hypothetical protein
MSAEGAASLRTTLLASASLGAALGLLFPTPHVAIEPAQVLAGLVAYPPDNPFGLYERRLWCVWHQLLAPLLAAGVGERALGFAVSGAVGALAFAALSALGFAWGAPPVWAVAAALLLWLLNPVGWGFNYPILLLGHPHTYGMAGLSWIALGVGLLGCGRLAAGAFVLGAAPAVHASLGLWTGLVTGACLLADWPRVRPHLGALLRGGLCGVALALASLALHASAQTASPDVDPVEVRRTLDAYLWYWDAHRGDLPLLGWHGAMVTLGVALALLLRRRTEAGVAATPGRVGAALLSRVYVAATLVGVAFVLLARSAAAAAIPHAVFAAMPTRLLNLPMLAFVPLVVGALAQRRSEPAARFALYALGAIALVWWRVPALMTWGLPLIAVIAAVLVARGARVTPAPAPTALRLVERAALIALAAMLAWTLGAVARGYPQRAAKLRDPGNDAVLAAAAAGSGLLVVAPHLLWTQLATRRPLLLDPSAIDMLPYAPDGGPAVARITAEVYGVDFLDPPPPARHQGAIDPRFVQPVWEARSAHEWSRLGERFGFREVLAPADWRLALEPVAKSGELALYRAQ